MLKLDVDYVLTRSGGVEHYVLVDPPSEQMTLDGTPPLAPKPFVPPMTECHSIELQESDVVVDIGAYCGTYAIWAARKGVRQVTAYEPTPRTFEVLALTQLPNLRLVNAAVVGDDREEVELWISSGIGVTNSIAVAKPRGHVVRVPAVRYEDTVAGATVVKVDVEGGEYAYSLVQPSLRAVIVDFHPVPGNWEAKAEEMIQGLKDAGFESVVEPNFANGWTRAGSWRR